ncbi:chitin synthase-domain-containing protein [Sporodiniella umbellata]|nr:chitin synthase-domain-containing protein [Sporodiniella umbellata]
MTSRSSIDDAHGENDLRTALKAIIPQKQRIGQIYQILAAILHLGNIQFTEDPSNAQDAAIIRNTDTLHTAADLLGVDPNSLVNTLTYKSKLIKRDITTLFLDPEQAAHQRDTLAQSLYCLLFTWILEQLNKKMLPKNSHCLVSLLDAPGWVTRPNNNGFDQFAFHYIQETIHSYTFARIYDRQDFEEQGIQISSDKIPSGINLDIYTHQSKGLWSIMNSHASRQQQRYDDDQQLIQNFSSVNKSAINEQLLAFKKSETGSQLFTIQHFWGSTTYDPHGFTERNQDYLSNDFIALFKGNAYSSPSTNGLVASLFDESIIGQDNGTRNRVHSPHQAIRPLRPLTNTQQEPRAADAKSIQSVSVQSDVSTIGHMLTSGITDLVNVLNQTLPWFVLCMRPNEFNLPNSFDVKKVAVQARLFKLAALSKRVKAGYYTVSFSLDEFWERYHISLPITTNSMIDPSFTIKEKCKFVIQKLNWNQNTIALGQDRIYLSSNAFRVLEDDLKSLEKAESKKSRLSKVGSGQKSFDMYSFNDDLASTAMSEDDYMDESGLQDYHGSDMMSQVTLENKNNQFMINGTHSHLLDSGLEKKGMTDGAKSIEEEPLSSIRKRWLAFVWFLTWWAPSPLLNHCGGMSRKDIRLAWREKVALCILIFLLSAAMVVFIVFFGPLICPHQDVYSVSEIQSKSDKKSAFVAIRGEVFDLTKFAPHHWASEVIPDEVIFEYAGKDATNLFPVQVSALCDGITGRIPEELVLDFQVNLTDKNAVYHDFRFFTNDYRPDWYFEQMVYMRKNYRLGFMGYEPSDILRQATNVVNVGDINTHRSWAILHGDVYDLTYYLMGGRAPRAPEGSVPPSNLDINFMDNSIVELFRQLAGTDISKHFDALPITNDLRSRQLVCLRNLFFVGKLDTRRSLQCLFSEYFLLIVTGFLCAVILFKFLAALQLSAFREPEDYDKFIICQVPCYTESEESLRKTIDSIAVLKYDDKRKLLFLVCDGMIIGSGNDRPTPRIVLDILGVDANVDPEPLSFLSLGEGIKQHNTAKIYSGLYECSGHVVPYVVVVKVGAPNERQKPGNRGKRDSQMVLMRFLNKVHFESPMTPMELEIFHQIKNVIGVNPTFYEFVLMVDADTEVLPDSLNRMVSCFVHDAKVIGLCGETKLANEKDSWVTMIQVYEYYISHFLAKAFESLFGSVTCLPGCFCMYRVRSPGKNQPLLVSNQVIDDYAENRVSTLHQKNLLHLGEDRYLTTLILKHFPTHKTKFTADAGCLTNAPDRWSVLLSQRRRWINSTIHNLGELVFLPQLCGFCCFSMRFVVILDLLSTLVMPAVVCYLGYLIYQLATNADQVPLISLITLCGVYGLQAIIFFARRKWEHIGWMIVYILAIPIFSFFIPVYSFWHFDDFSWGNTRLVLGEDGTKTAVAADEGKFDPKCIPLKKWSDHENELWESNSVETKTTAVTSASRRTTNNPYSPQTPAMGYSNTGYMTPNPNYAPSMNQMNGANSIIGGAFYNNDSASFRYSQQNLTSARAPSVGMDNSLFNPPASSVYSFEGSHHGGYPGMMNMPIIEGDSYPLDEDIRREVQRITATSNLMTITKKQVREQLSRHFGVNMAHRKDFINYCIEESLNH